ncbi:class C beta-lactamase-related serine hydrolase [Nocardioides immobilis]|uniref:Class C beta-lactamase-related serine hydrolase n=1 Tax=Nocardioides immobilis TaxID=2049295 RepID=A0A417XXB6_9ACTN|nr:class C beta-lactamase-related serine hydrolase [Nocardioides immobilis]
MTTQRSSFMPRRTLAAVAIAVSLGALSVVPVGPARSAHASVNVRTDIDLPNPTQPSEFGRLLPSTPIAPARDVRPLRRSHEQIPATVPWGRGQRKTVADFLTTTHTRAFVVLHRGRLVTEWYDAHTGPTTKLASWSVAKAMAGLLTGQAITEGRLTLDTRVVTVLPWLRVEHPADGDPRFNTITVRHLLDMTSGIDAAEGYQVNPLEDPTAVLSMLTGTYLMLVHPNMHSFASSHRRMVFDPGTRGEYVSYNTQLLSMVLSEVFGTDYITAFVNRLWRPAGAQYPATWNLDHGGGIAKAFCCLNATARDFARLGLLVAEAGGPGSRVSRAWLDRILTPQPKPLGGWPYSTQFWHVPGDQRGKRANDVSAIGVFGQYIYLNRRTQTVIVKLSDHGIEEDEALTFRAMRSIARSWRH